MNVAFLASTVVVVSCFLVPVGCQQEERPADIGEELRRRSADVWATLEPCFDLTRLPEPWSAVERTGATSIAFRASADALQIDHKPGEFAQQRFITVWIGAIPEGEPESRLIGPPHRIRESIRLGQMTSGRSLSAGEWRFVEYLVGDTPRYVDWDQQALCIDTSPSARSLPNPYIRCELVRGDYVVRFHFSALGTSDLPRITESVWSAVQATRDEAAEGCATSAPSPA